MPDTRHIKNASLLAFFIAGVLCDDRLQIHLMGQQVGIFLPPLKHLRLKRCRTNCKLLFSLLKCRKGIRRAPLRVRQTLLTEKLPTLLLLTVQGIGEVTRSVAKE